MAMAKIQKMTELQQLAHDLYNGKVEKFSNKEAQTIIENAIIEACGGNWDYYSFQDNKNKVFKVLGEVLGATVYDRVIKAFDSFVDVRDTELGDTIEYTIESPSLYIVATISHGVNDLRRQRITGRKMTLSPVLLSLKIYEEIDMLIAGRVDFNAMIDRVGKSMERAIAVKIGETFQNAYTSLNSNLVVNGSYDDQKLVELVNKVEGMTGKKCKIYGTASAIAKINTELLSTTDKEDARDYGYVRMFKGTEVVKLEQAYNQETNKWSVNNDRLYIIPEGEKVVKLAFEGTPYVQEITDGNSRLDMQVEYMLSRKIQLGVLTSAAYGCYVMA